MSTRNTLSAAVAILACATPAWAATPVQLQFEGLTVNEGGNRNDVRVSDFYNDGWSKTIPDLNNAARGVPLGVTTRGDLATASETDGAVNPAGGTGTNTVVPYLRDLKLSNGTTLNASNELGLGFMYVQGDPVGPVSASFDFAGGFDTGVSFFYSTSKPQDLIVTLLDGSDSVVASLQPLAATAACVGSSLYTRWEWAEAFIPYSGRATGVRFSGETANFFIDNLTFGSLSARTLTDGGEQPAPEPSTYALMALGLGGIALTTRRRQRKA